MPTLKITSAKVKKLSKGQRGQQHGHVRDHVNINKLSNMAMFIDHVQGNTPRNRAMFIYHVEVDTPWNMATLKTTSTKFKELSKSHHGQQHGHVQDHVHMNTPFNMAMLKTTSREFKKVSKG
ncbi:unnamed protein product [Linum trigynum]|uniref:Uncharacterized protein n=1 Tax=Linum trigynum TaxID=586398 RepID=A0AAV2E3V4_9ROSI